MVFPAVSSAASPAPPAAFPERLTHGYQTFLQGRFARERSRYRALGEDGQNPDIMVIGCCDSRVSPEVIFDAGPGELFVVRNVANLVPPFEPDTASYHGTSAAIEYAVNTLAVRHIVVLGHAACGGIRAFVEHDAALARSGFIAKWMSQIDAMAGQLALPAHDEDPDRAATLARLELAVVEHSVANLLTFPDVRVRVNAGTLALHAAFFGVATGLLFVRDAQTGRFDVCGSE